MTISRKPAHSTHLTHLTPRQLQVLRGIWDGQTHEELAHGLGIGVKGVEFHWTRAKAKFGCGNRIQILRQALRQGLLKP